MPLDVAKLLDSFASTLRVTTAQAAPGHPVTASLSPLQFPDVEITEILDGAVDIDWISQSVKFSQLLGAGTPTGQSDILDKAPGTLPVNPTLGTEGVLNRLRGTVPVPIQSKLPVGLQISWRVTTDKAGNSEAPSLNAGADASQIPNKWCLPLTAPDVPAPSFLFSVGTCSLTSGPPTTTRWYIWATVTLSLPVENGTKEKVIGPIAIDVPDLPIPSLLALFNHHSFAPFSGTESGYMLLVIPNASPLPDLEALRSTLGALTSAVSTIRSTLSTLGFAAAFTPLASLADGLGLVNTALGGQPHIAFAKADYISDLSVFQFESRGAWRLTAEDSIGSMIFIGPPGSTVELFNLRDAAFAHGAFELRVGEGGVTLVHGLGDRPPGTVPANKLRVLRETPPDWSFTNHLSSLSFVSIPRRDRLLAGQFLSPGEMLVSENLFYACVYTRDGNLVVWGLMGSRLWYVDVPGDPGQAWMQKDGHFVVYDPSGTPKWASGAAGFPHASSAFLVMQNDGNLVVYGGDGRPRWDRASGPL